MFSLWVWDVAMARVVLTLMLETGMNTVSLQTIQKRSPSALCHLQYTVLRCWPSCPYVSLRPRESPKSLLLFFRYFHCSQSCELLRLVNFCRLPQDLGVFSFSQSRALTSNFTSSLFSRESPSCLTPDHFTGSSVVPPNSPW